MLSDMDSLSPHALCSFDNTTDTKNLEQLVCRTCCLFHQFACLHTYKFGSSIFGDCYSLCMRTQPAQVSILDLFTFCLPLPPAQSKRLGEWTGGNSKLLVQLVCRFSLSPVLFISQMIECSLELNLKGLERLRSVPNQKGTHSNCHTSWCPVSFKADLTFWEHSCLSSCLLCSIPLTNNLCSHLHSTIVLLSVRVLSVLFCFVQLVSY
jgi:hypothetical protein